MIDAPPPETGASGPSQRPDDTASDAPVSVLRRRTGLVALDRSLELLPLFRLSDSGEEGAVSYTVREGHRWRVLPAPGERVPGTFDQDVYIELMYRYHESGAPADGVIRFTLHAFLRAMGRKVDGRTYEQLRAALVRLERTTLDAGGAYTDADGSGRRGAFALLTAVVVERRRGVEREQIPLFPGLLSGEPGDARATIATPVRANVDTGRVSFLSVPLYRALGSPVARRLYRLLAAVDAAATADDGATVPGSLEATIASDGVPAAVVWTVPLDRLAELMPLSQRYPSHLQRVLEPAHAVLQEVGVAAAAEIRQDGKEWMVRYVLG